MGLHGTKVLLGPRPARPGRVHRRRAERPARRAGRARRRVDHRDRARAPAAHGSTPAPRRQRDHVDGAVPAAARGGAPRPRAPARRAAERERRGHHGRQRAERRPRSLRARHRPADRPRRDGPGGGAGTVRAAGRGRSARAPRGRPDVRDRRVDRRGGGGARHGHRGLGPPGDRRRTRRGGAADVGFTGITDARFYINDVQIPTIIMGPGSLSVAHTANEWVLVDDLVAAARIYARIFVGFLGARAR